MKANNIMKTLLVAGIALVGLNSCQEKLHFFAEGDEVKFTVGSSQEVETKAAYQEFTGSEAVGDMVRVDWQEGDLVRVYCEQSDEPEEKYADYIVNKVLGNDGAVSKARIGHTSWGQMGLRWGKSETHHFYAAFPSPDSEGVTKEIKKNVVTALLPAEQNTLEGALSVSDGNYTLAPDLKWQLMTAYKACSPDAGISDADGVFLKFNPRSTAINFTISNGLEEESNGEQADLIIDKIELISDATQISGGYSLDIADGTVTGTSVTDATRSVYVTIPGGGITLKSGKTFNFTLFLAPTQDINDLTFKIYKHSDNGGTPEYTWMSTKLAYNDAARTGVVFPKSKITFVKGLIVPEGAQWQVKYSPDVSAWGKKNEGGIDINPELDPQMFVSSWQSGVTTSTTMTKYYYVFEVDGNFEFGHSGTAESEINIISRKEPDHDTRKPVLWHVEYYDDNTKQWIVPDEKPTVIGGLVTFDHVSGTPAPGSKGICQETVKIKIEPAATPETALTHTQVLSSAQSKGTSSLPYDLSMHDIFGNERAGLGTDNAQPVTANSYVINAPGVYAFPLVYGNGVDYIWAPAGGENSNAYNPGSETPSTSVKLNRFINSKGEGIRSPYIETDLQSSVNSNWKVNVTWYGSTTAAFTAADCAVLSRTDAHDMGLNACNCGYVTFTVDKTKIKQGNALITVSDGSKTVWSWHIWITDNDLTPNKVITTTEGMAMNMMPINLGWVDEDTDPHYYYEGKTLRIKFVQDGSKAEREFVLNRKAESDWKHEAGTSTYYQWGRKDPFESTVDPTPYSTSTTIGYLVQNPGTFVTGDRWYYATDEKDEDDKDIPSTYLNLWSSLNGIAPAPLDTKPVKTIYDPCPPGFQVPQGNAFSHFSTSTGTWTNNKGYYFTTGYSTAGVADKIFVNAAGYVSNDGVLTTGAGYYWTAVPYSYTDSYILKINNTQVLPQENIKWANGLSVRPVQE